MSELFVTGITGLVGRAVTAELAARGLEAAALVRPPAPPLAGGLAAVEGDLVRPLPEAAREALAGSRTVLHMAAATGAADPETFERVNLEGTRRLLEAATAVDVGRFVFVSSIAAAFPETGDYPYAASKRGAERLVRESGLDAAIVRPTVVLGPGSPILERFRQLAALPVSPLPGGGKARIQPIAAADLARCLVDLALEPRLGGRTIEIGGADIVTLAAFLGRVRRARGSRPGPILRVPLGPVRAGLRAAERLTGGRFPISPAQLAMFEHDGVAASHPFVEERRGSFAPLDDALREAMAA